VSSIEPDEDGGGVDTSQEVDGALVVAGGDGPELLELAEEVLDEVALLVDFSVIVARVRSCGFGRDDRGDAGGSERLDDPLVGVEGAIGEQVASPQTGQEGVRAVQIVSLAGRKQKLGRPAVGVDQSVDLGAQSASAEPNGFVVSGLFLRAPALC